MTTDVDGLKEWVSEWNEEALLADGFEDAIVGICERFGALPVAAYDRVKCIEILVERDGMNYDEALEYFDFNVAGAYVGDGTPVFLTLRDKG
jgi:hypothetical protein